MTTTRVLVVIVMGHPNKKDTDDDGLTDKEEIMFYKTDPNNKDTDGGTASDGEEVLERGEKGTDPTDDRDDVDPPLCCCPADGGDAAAYVEVTSAYKPDTVVADCEALRGCMGGEDVHQAFVDTYNVVVFAADAADGNAVCERIDCGCYKNAEGYEGNDDSNNSPVDTGTTSAAEQEGSGTDRGDSDANEGKKKIEARISCLC